MEIYSLIIKKVCPSLNDWSNTILFKDNSNGAASKSDEYSCTLVNFVSIKKLASKESHVAKRLSEL